MNQNDPVINEQKTNDQDIDVKRAAAKEARKRRWRIFVRRYLTFFLLMSFVITCSMILFMHYMFEAMSIEIQAEHIRLAAIMTFGNVMFLAVFCTLFDWIRRKKIGRAHV